MADFIPYENGKILNLKGNPYSNTYTICGTTYDSDGNINCITTVHTRLLYGGDLKSIYIDWKPNNPFKDKIEIFNCVKSRSACYFNARSLNTDRKYEISLKDILSFMAISNKCIVEGDFKFKRVSCYIRLILA